MIAECYWRAEGKQWSTSGNPQERIPKAAEKRPGWDPQGQKKNEHNQIANGEHPENFRMKCEQQLTGNHL